MKKLTVLTAVLATLHCGAPWAATLPLKAGDYVLAGQSCTEAPLAALAHFDGNNFSGPHSGACTSTVLKHDGNSYQVQTRCTAQGDGTPAQPDTLVETYRIDAPTTFVRQTGKQALSYRLCPAQDSAAQPGVNSSRKQSNASSR